MNLEKTEIEQQEEQEIKKIKVYITGEVNNPGVKELAEGARIEDIINLAGGLTEFANIRNVNLAYEIEDGGIIYKDKVCILLGSFAINSKCVQ